MAKFEVIANDLGQMEDSINKFGDACADLEADFDSLVKMMADLNAMWTGEAHDALLARFDDDRKGVLEMISLMKEIHSDLAYAKEEYGRCEKNVSGIIESINI